MSRFQEIIGEALKWWFPGKVILVDHRPSWLFGMELDFFIPELNLAVEVQGEQHYRFVKEFHRTRMDLRNQKDRDRRKRALCREQGVILLAAKRNHGLICCGLKQKFHKLGIRLPHLPETIKDKWKQHNAVLQRLKVGAKRANSEWKKQQKFEDSDYCPACGMLRSQCDCWDPVNQI